jgi:hypothetical protein
VEENAPLQILHVLVFRLALIFHFCLLTLVAYYYNPYLNVARARWGWAKAGIITVGARPNPSLLTIPEFSANPPGGVSLWTVGPVWDIPLETAGKRSYRISRKKELLLECFLGRW